MYRRILLLGAILAVTSGIGAAADADSQPYFTYNPPRATENRDRIEVTEFFWYGCGHCYRLDPFIQSWLKKLPKDVVFRRIPAVFPGRDGAPGGWAPGAKLYYAMEALGLLDKLHGEVFSAIHRDRINLSNEKLMVEWLAKKGVDTTKFMEVYNSFAVQAKVSRAMQLSESHGLDGVPVLIVDGHYRAPGDSEDALVLVDQLIDKTRKERAGRK